MLQSHSKIYSTFTSKNKNMLFSHSKVIKLNNFIVFRHISYYIYSIYIQYISCLLSGDTLTCGTPLLAYGRSNYYG